MNMTTLTALRKSYMMTKAIPSMNTMQTETSQVRLIMRRQAMIPIRERAVEMYQVTSRTHRQQIAIIL